MTTLEARFAVDGWDDRPVPGLSGEWFGTIEMRKTFTSGLVGTSVALFVSSGDIEGQRSYFAAERITASLAADGGQGSQGRADQGGAEQGSAEQGSVTVHHGGLESAPDSWFGHVVPGSGTGPFAGWSGPARIIHDESGPYFAFEVG